MSAVHKLLSRLQDPQSWVGMIAVVTVLGLCTGAFEPVDAAGPGAQTGRSAQVVAGDTLLAAADTQTP